MSGLPKLAFALILASVLTLSLIGLAIELLLYVLHRRRCPRTRRSIPDDPDLCDSSRPGDPLPHRLSSREILLRVLRLKNHSRVEPGFAAAATPAAKPAPTREEDEEEDEEEEERELAQWRIKYFGPTTLNALYTIDEEEEEEEETPLTTPCATPQRETASHSPQLAAEAGGDPTVVTGSQPPEKLANDGA